MLQEVLMFGVLEARGKSALKHVTPMCTSGPVPNKTSLCVCVCLYMYVCVRLNVDLRMSQLGHPQTLRMVPNRGSGG